MSVARIPIALVASTVLCASALAVDAELRKLARDPDSFKRSDAARELAREGSKEAAELLVRLMQDVSPYVRDHAVDACGQLRAADAVAEIAGLAGAKEELPRLNALQALGGMEGGESFTHFVTAFRAEKSPAVRGAALDALWGRKGSEDVLALCNEAYRSTDAEVRAAAVEVAGRIRADGALALTMTALADPDPGVCCVAAMELRFLDRDAAEELFATHVLSPHWTVRAQVVDDAREIRRVPSMDALVTLVGDANTRVAAAAHRALRTLSGKGFGRDPELWKGWWEQARASWKPPRERLDELAQNAEPGRTRAAYHGVEVDSSQIAFVLDLSGSMGDPMSNDRKRSRWEVAREELQKTLDALPDTTVVNVLLFQESVSTAFEGPVPLSRKNRRALATFLKRGIPAQAGNLLEGVLDALDQQGVDTVFLLSDGAPSAGDMVDKDRVRHAIRRRVRVSKQVVHCIGFGAEKKTERTFLANVAYDSGGVVVYR